MLLISKELTAILSFYCSNSIQYVLGFMALKFGTRAIIWWWDISIKQVYHGDYVILGVVPNLELISAISPDHAILVLSLQNIMPQLQHIVSLDYPSQCFITGHRTLIYSLEKTFIHKMTGIHLLWSSLGLCSAGSTMRLDFWRKLNAMSSLALKACF